MVKLSEVYKSNREFSHGLDLNVMKLPFAIFCPANNIVSQIPNFKIF